MLLYPAGKYSADTKKEVHQNIEAARKIAIEIWKLGHYCISPHLNSQHMEDDGIPWETFMSGDLSIISRCDGVVMIPGWEESRGASLEFSFATDKGIPIWMYPDLPDSVEVRDPSDMYEELLGPSKETEYASPCLEAHKIVNGPRAATYGDARENMTRIVNTFNALTGYGLSPEDGIKFMICLKLARLENSWHTDGLIDVAGYVEMWSRVHKDG